MGSRQKVIRHLDNMILKQRGSDLPRVYSEDDLWTAFLNVGNTQIKVNGHISFARKLFENLDNNNDKERREIYSQFYKPFSDELNSVIKKSNKNSRISGDQDALHQKSTDGKSDTLNINSSISNPIQSSKIPQNASAFDDKGKISSRINELGRENSRRYFLRNGKVGQKYFDELDLKQLVDSGTIASATIENLELIGGLVFDPIKLTISGVPLESGSQELNYEILLKVRYQLSSGAMDAREIGLRIFPEPKSLWKTIEPEDSITDRKPHEEYYFVQTPIVNIDGKIVCAAGGSKRGRSHAHDGSFRDDHFKIEYVSENGCLLVAVADGAGSSKFSRVGSEIACQTAISFIKKSLETNYSTLFESIIPGIPDDGLIKTILYSMLGGAAFDGAKKIEIEANRRGLKSREFYTTLLLVLVMQVDKRYFIAGFGIGDGAISVKLNDGKVLLLNKPDGGDFGGQTRFVTMPEVLTAEELLRRTSYIIVDDFSAIFSMTDGVSDPWFETDNNLNDSAYWEKLTSELTDKNVLPLKNGSEEQLNQWLDFWSEGNHDDRTLVIIQ